MRILCKGSILAVRLSIPFSSQPAIFNVHFKANQVFDLGEIIYHFVWRNDQNLYLLNDDDDLMSALNATKHLSCLSIMIVPEKEGTYVRKRFDLGDEGQILADFLSLEQSFSSGDFTYHNNGYKHDFDKECYGPSKTIMRLHKTISNGMDSSQMTTASSPRSTDASSAGFNIFTPSKPRAENMLLSSSGGQQQRHGTPYNETEIQCLLSVANDLRHNGLQPTLFNFSEHLTSSLNQQNLTFENVFGNRGMNNVFAKFKQLNR